MAMPGFSAESAVGQSGSHRGVAGAHWAAGSVEPQLIQDLRNRCYRNCINRCGGPISDENLSGCIALCLYLCEWNPTIWF